MTTDHIHTDIQEKKEFIRRHIRVFNRVEFYFPVLIAVSTLLTAVNHSNHPLNMAQLTSLVMKEGDTYFENKWISCVTILSFSWQLILVFYFYLALYQFLLYSITVARGYKWCLEHITKEAAELMESDEGTLDFLQERMKLAVTKFEHLRAGVIQYNGIFSGLLFFCKAMLIMQITLMSYIPLRRSNTLPFSTTMTLMGLTLHQVIRTGILLIEMGKVYRVSGQFTETWMRLLVGRITLHGHVEEKHNEVSKPRDARVNGDKWTGFLMKSQLETCKPFGFDSGGCYVVTPNTILTFFSIVTSYLIIMLQLQI